MSNRHLDHVFAHGPAGRSERLVLLALADRAHAATGICDPSMADIATRCGMSERGVRKVVRRLEAAGWIEVEVCRGRGHRNRFRVILRTPAATAEEAEKTGTAQPENRNGKTGTRDRFSDKTGTDVHENRNLRSAEPLENPKREEGGARETAPPIEEPPPPEVAPPPERLPPAVDDNRLLDRVMAAAGVGRNGRLPSRWLPPGAEIHVAGWRQLGLNDEQILEVIRAEQTRHSEPPDGPKAFDRAMRSTADALRHAQHFTAETEGQTHVTDHPRGSGRVIPFQHAARPREDPFISACAAIAGRPEAWD